MFWANRGRELSLKRHQQQQQNCFGFHSNYFILLLVVLWSVIWFYGAFHFIYSISSSENQSVADSFASNNVLDGSIPFSDNISSRNENDAGPESNEDEANDEERSDDNDNKNDNDSDEKEEENKRDDDSEKETKYLRGLRNDNGNNDDDQQAEDSDNNVEDNRDGNQEEGEGSQEEENKENELNENERKDDEDESNEDKDNNQDDDRDERDENDNSNRDDDNRNEEENDEPNENNNEGDSEDPSEEEQRNDDNEQPDDGNDSNNEKNENESNGNDDSNIQQSESDNDIDEFEQTEHNQADDDQENNQKFQLQEESGSLSDTLPETPNFWKPDENDDLDSIGYLVDDEPTIFVGIASYRDSMCHETISMIFERAKYPSRVFVGAVEQNAPNDESCIFTKSSCDDDPEQTICKYMNQIRLHRVHAKFALGPTFGRHRADSLYRGETFALQIDAHMYFIKNWDISAISQWTATKNEYAVLSNYPSDSTDALDASARSKIYTTPGICKSDFVDGGMLKHGSAMEFYPPSFINKGEPILVPFWGAGVSFSKGHRIVRVPYDCCLPMLFDGEETSMLVRMWTHGYDIYTFYSSIVFHPYFRKQKPPMFWENSRSHPGDVGKAQRRISRILGTSVGYPPSETNPDPLDVEIQYRLGKKRQASQFWKLFGIDFVNRKIRNNCAATTSGQIHRALTPFLRTDGKGIDYSLVPMDKFSSPDGFRTMAAMAHSQDGIYKELRDRHNLLVKAKKAMRGS